MWHPSDRLYATAEVAEGDRNPSGVKPLTSDLPEQQFEGDGGPPPCPYCGHPEFKELPSNGRADRAQCAQCGGMVYSVNGSQWQPELIGDPSNHPSSAADPASGGVGGAANSEVLMNQGPVRTHDDSQLRNSLSSLVKTADDDQCPRCSGDMTDTAPDRCLDCGYTQPTRVSDNPPQHSGQRVALLHTALSWDEIGDRHPHVYGDSEIHGDAADGADGPGIGSAANYLAHETPEDPDGEGHSEHELEFRARTVHPRHIDYSPSGSDDYRVKRAREGYQTQPEMMPPLVLVKRHNVYQVADGHHRAEAAASLNQPVRAYIADSPYPDTPFRDGEIGPFHHAEPIEAEHHTAAKPRPSKSFPNGKRHGIEITDGAYPDESGIVQCDNCGKYHSATYDHEGQHHEGPIHAVTCPQDGMTDYYTNERLEPREAALNDEVPWCAHLYHGNCTYPGDKLPNGTILGIPQDRGPCPWKHSAFQQAACPISAPGPMAVMTVTAESHTADGDYRMQHQAPDADYGAPLHDVEEMMPDFYTHPHYYNTGQEHFWDSANKIIKARGNPEKKVQIYRSLPADYAHEGFHTGDWVTTSKDYAREHGKATEDKGSEHDWPIISTRVPAKHLHTEGDVHEWAYNGPEKPFGHTVSFPGGREQQIRQRADGTVQRVKHRPVDPLNAQGYSFSHHMLNENSDNPAHQVTAYGPDENYAGHHRVDAQGTVESHVEPEHEHMADPLRERMANEVTKRMASLHVGIEEMQRIAIFDGEEQWHLTAVTAGAHDSDTEMKGFGLDPLHEDDDYATLHHKFSQHYRILDHVYASGNEAHPDDVDAADAIDRHHRDHDVPPITDSTYGDALPHQMASVAAQMMVNKRADHRRLDHPTVTMERIPAKDHASGDFKQGSVLGDYQHDISHIRLDPYVLANAEINREEHAPQSDARGWHVPAGNANPWQTTISHEGGHHREMSLTSQQRASMFRDISHTIPGVTPYTEKRATEHGLNKWHNANYAHLINHVGTYAAKNYRELAAELYSEHRHADNPSLAAQTAGRHLEGRFDDDNNEQRGFAGEFGEASSYGAQRRTGSGHREGHLTVGGVQAEGSLTFCTDTEEMQRVAALDKEGQWHLTASWADVKDKAKLIRAGGGVRIAVASMDGIGGEVQGEHHVYETLLTFVPGSYKVGSWQCGCKWAAYAWGRSPAYRRFEGRMCSHALAMQYEAQARGMFGRTVQEDRERPHWLKPHSPVVVQYERPSEKHPQGIDLTRRAVPPGNMRTTFGSKEAAMEPAQLIALAVLTMCDHDPVRAIPSLGLYGFDHRTAQLLIKQATEHEDAESLSVPPLRLEQLHPEPMRSTASKRCPECSASVSSSALTCPECGANLADVPELHEASWQDEEQRCPHCGGYLGPTAFKAGRCPHCGHALSHREGAYEPGLHNTQDARMNTEAPDWGTDHLVPCDQCRGQGCGHCGGTGNVVQMNGVTGSPVPDQSEGAGDVMRQDGLAWGDPISMGAVLAAHEDDPTYLRFGSWPKDERSRNNITGFPEEGVSVYDLDHRGEPKDPDANFGRLHEHHEHCDPDCDLDSWNEDYGNDTLEEMRGRVHRAERTRYNGNENHSDTGHLVKGEMAGIGHDGEPLLKNVRRVGDWIDHRHLFFPQAERHRLARDPYDEDYEEPKLNKRSAKKQESHAPSVAGVALKAADTGRVLMLQRGLEDKKDPAAGTWEFPGGHIEPGDKTSLHGAMREWEEEVGQPFPDGGVVHHVWTSPNGVYQGHVVVIPAERDLTMHDGRVMTNPDDPHGDHAEQAAWWQVEHARKNPALRPEVKQNTPWKQLANAGMQKEADYAANDALSGGGPEVHTPTDAPQHSNSTNPASTGYATSWDPNGWNGEEPFGGRDDVPMAGYSASLAPIIEPRYSYQPPQAVASVLGQWGQGQTPVVFERAARTLATLHDEPEPALPSTDGGDERMKPINHLHHGIPHNDQGTMPYGYDDLSEFREDHPEVPTRYTNNPFDPYYGDSNDTGQDSIGDTEDSLSPNSVTAAGHATTHDASVADIVAQFQATAAAGQLMTSGGAPTNDGMNIAAAAQAHLRKSALKDFNFHEQQELINEGARDRTRARNMGDLRIEGTHYEMLPDDEDANLFV